MVSQDFTATSRWQIQEEGHCNRPLQRFSEQTIEEAQVFEAKCRSRNDVFWLLALKPPSIPPASGLSLPVIAGMQALSQSFVFDEDVRWYSQVRVNDKTLS